MASVPFFRIAENLGQIAAKSEIDCRVLAAFFTRNAKWNEDAGAQQNAVSSDANGAQSVDVILSPALLESSELFVRIRAE